MLRIGGITGTEQFAIFQNGTTENDLVAVRTIEGAGGRRIFVLRIRTWQDTLPFSLLSDDEVFVGNCRLF